MLVKYNGKQKLQYTFNKNGDIVEYIIFGDHHHRDTTYLGNVSKFKYRKSNLIKRLDYKSHYLSTTRYSNKRGKIVSVSKDGKLTKRNIYDRAGKIISEIYLNEGDTSSTVIYKYEGNLLVEKFHFWNDMENERTVYNTSGDTIVETLTIKDSVSFDIPKIIVLKKKYEDFKIVYCSRSSNKGKSIIQYFIKYDSSGILKKIEERHYESKTVKRYKTEFTYRNGIVYTIQSWILMDDVWRSIDMTAYFTRKRYEELSPQSISNINSYFTKEYVSFEY